jgi:DNA-binding CsgD family transcriptional regulator
MGSRPEKIVDVQELAAVETDMLAEVIYYVAFASYIAGDAIGAETWLASHTPSTPAMRARYLIQRGVFAAARDHFAVQVEFTNAALDILEREAPDELYLLANAARTLAVVARDLNGVTQSIPRLERLHVLLSIDGFTGARFHLLRALGWAHAVQGNYEAAMGYIVRAMTHVSNDIERLFAYLDHATVAILIGEQDTSFARGTYRVAREIVEATDWDSISNDAIAALPLAAQVAAELGDSDDALRYCEKAEERSKGLDPLYIIAHDARLPALIAEARALATAGHDTKGATASATAAFNAFSHLGFHWRAARMAILLHQMTRRVSWRTRASELLAEYPESPFHRLLDTGVGRDRTMTLRQSQVLERVLRGQTDLVIAGELGISYGTIRVHLGRLFKRFDVSSRAELIALHRKTIQVPVGIGASVQRRSGRPSSVASGQ